MIKNLFTYIITLLLFINDGFAQTKPQEITETLADTTMPIIKEAKEIIDEIIETKALPQKDKIQYFSKLTRYGFKNLFPTYSYNSSMPYSSQVTPQAESFMQDYLRVHGRQLTGMKSWCMPYFNLIDNIFTQYGLPKELKYLAAA